MLKKFLRIFFFTASLTLAACSNITSAPDEAKENSTTGATLSGRLIVNGALPSASSGTQSARTAFPTVPESFTYRVTAQKGSETVTGTVDASDPDDITYSISFPSSGNWTVTAEALSSSTVFLSASATVDAANDSGKNFLLRYPSTSTSGTGTVNLKISYADTIPVTSIAAKMVGFDTATVSVNNSSFTTSGSYKTFTYTRSSVPLGPHKLTVYFKDSSGQTIYYLEQIVNVYKGFETNKFYGDELYIDASSGEIKLEESHLNTTALTTFYVHGTNGTATGTGSIFSPVKTLGQAANLVTNSTATPADGFRIILQTNTTETSNIALTKKTEIITDAGDGTKRTVNGDSHSLTSTADINFTDINFSQMAGFKVESGTVIMGNGEFSICIGNVVDSNYCGGAVFTASGATFKATDFDFNLCVASGGPGGAIYSEGTVTLTNCNITNCMAGYGGAIYSKGTLNLTNCVLSKNYASNEGGAIHAVGTSTVAANINMDNCTIGVESPTSVASEDKDTCIEAGGNYSEGAGGGILLDAYSSLTAIDSKINGNYAGGAGGAINASDGNATLELGDSEVLYNKANGQGGGLQIYSTQGAESFVENTAIKYNSSNADGGGISVTTGKYFKVDACTDISDNTATGKGKGVYAAGKLTLDHTTYIADGIYLNTYASPLTLNNDFALSGADTIPLLYNNASFDASDDAKNTLIKGSASTSLTETQCNAFTLTSTSGTPITEYIIKYISTSPYKGILAEPSSGGTSFTVGSSSDCDFPTLVDALAHVDTLSAATAGNEYEIKICEDITLSDNLSITTSHIKITSDTDTTPRTINGGSGSAAYQIEVNAEGVIVDSINFSGLKGGINVAGHDLTLNNSTVMNGSTDSDSFASGITIASGATLKSEEGLVIDSCDSSSSYHSGIYSNGGTVDLTGTEIWRCDSRTTAGAIYCKGNSTIKLRNCDIHDNGSRGNGGAIYCSQSTVELTGTTKIHDNSIDGDYNGGGIYVSGDSSTFTMEESVEIQKNTGYHGGGIYVFSGTIKVYLDSSSPSGKDKDNVGTSGALCYIRDAVTILAGSTINGTPWSAATVLTSSYIVN
jgi:predicted outer membrane repeat protein